MITMGDIYQEMKDALEYFGLRFHQMEEVEVILGEDKITFRYKGRTIETPIADTPT